MSQEDGSVRVWRILSIPSALGHKYIRVLGTLDNPTEILSHFIGTYTFAR